MVKFQFAIAGAASTLVASAAAAGVTPSSADGDSASLFSASFATKLRLKADGLSNGRTLRGLDGSCDVAAVANCVQSVPFDELIEAPTCGTIQEFIKTYVDCGYFDDACAETLNELELPTCEEVGEYIDSITDSTCEVGSICGSGGNLTDSLGALEEDSDGDDNNANGTVADYDDDDYEGDYDDNNLNGTMTRNLADDLEDSDDDDSNLNGTMARNLADDLDDDDYEGDYDDNNLNGTMTRNLADDLEDSDDDDSNLNGTMTRNLADDLDDDDYEGDDYGYDGNSTMASSPIIDDDLGDDYNGDGNSTLPEDVDEDY